MFRKLTRLLSLESNLGEEAKKSAAQFEALEKGDDLPEKEPIKAFIVKNNCQLSA